MSSGEREEAPPPGPPEEGVLERWDREGSLDQLIVIVPDDVDLSAAPSPPVERPTLAEVAAEVEGEIDAEVALGADRDRALFAVPRVLRIVALAAVAALGLLLYAGHGYYQAPLAERPLHALHRALRPSGLVGLPLGIAGALLIAASTGYVVRKRLVSRPRFAALRAWMGFHVFAGLLGPALVLLHAAFVPTSALGLLALASLAVVVASGLFGRHVYASFPKTLEGRALGLNEVRKRLAVYERDLAALDAGPGVIAPLDARAPLERRRVLERRLARERRWLARYDDLRRLMGIWRFLHVWLAVVTGLAVAGHVAIAVLFGDLWVLGGRR